MSDDFKTPLKIADAVVTKTVHLRAEDVFGEVHRRVGDLRDQFGPDAQPVRVLLGPNQFLLVSEFHRTNPHAIGVESTRGLLGYPDKVLGIPAGLKRSDGIEFEFAPHMVMIFAHGSIKEERR